MYVIRVVCGAAYTQRLFDKMLILLLLVSVCSWAGLLSPETAVRGFVWSMFSVILFDVVRFFFPVPLERKKESE
jgi:hypothetical protein